MDPAKEKLKNAVRYFYDLQELRKQSANRAAKKAEAAQANLDDDDKRFLDSMGTALNGIEKDALREIKRLLKGIPIWEQYLSDIKGIGPTLGGILIAEFNIERCETASQMWAWAGLAVQIDENGVGHAQRRVKGEKAKFNPWLKSKMLKVMGDCLIKASNPTYRSFYDNYKHRKENQQVQKCMGCNGTGQANRQDDDVELEPGQKKVRKKVTCPNCGGTGGPAPWGASKAHRHAAANRYMVKMFLLDFWKAWRTLEGLPVRPPYAEQYLGRSHHNMDNQLTRASHIQVDDQPSEASP